MVSSFLPVLIENVLGWHEEYFSWFCSNVDLKTTDFIPIWPS